MFFRKFYSIFTQFILPSTCLLCGFVSSSSQLICAPCLKDLPILPHSCRQCAESLPSLNHHQRVCGTCLGEPPHFDNTYALFPYHPPIIQMIARLKFQQQLSYAKGIAALFIQRIQQTWYHNKLLPDLIIPIPLHAARLRQRGFNQAYEIAKPIAKFLKLPIDFSSSKRIKNTIAQSQLPAVRRQENIANAFIVERRYTGLTIAVIDDVITTGYTVSEFCRILRQSGAKNIDIWCCARSQKSTYSERC
ncbi:MAG TPA: ComF family protein [Gammaproteobacteria bacterium]|nr:ComF family protein [Gammaproteobacteria bacterium]